MSENIQQPTEQLAYTEQATQAAMALRGLEFQLDLYTAASSNTASRPEKRLEAKSKADETATALMFVQEAAEQGLTIDEYADAQKVQITGNSGLEGSTGEKNRLLAELQKTHEIAGQDFTHLAESPTFQAWERLQSIKAAAQEREGLAQIQQAERTERDEQAGEAREAINDAFIEQVVDASGVTIETDMPSKYANNKVQGFSSKESGKWAGQSRPSRQHIEKLFGTESNRTGATRGDVEKFYQDKGIHEAVAFTPVTKDEYGDIEVATKGRFGRVTKTAQRQVVGALPVSANEVLANSSDEPLVEMTYKVFPHPDYTDNETRWRTSDGRDGNILTVSMMLPQSLARQVEAAGKKDPELIRTIAETATVRAIGVSEELYRNGSEETRGNPMRAPHEAWRSASGGKSKMYFQPSNTRQFDQSGVVTF